MCEWNSYAADVCLDKRFVCSEGIKENINDIKMYPLSFREYVDLICRKRTESILTKGEFHEKKGNVWIKTLAFGMLAGLAGCSAPSVDDKVVQGLQNLMAKPNTRWMWIGS